MIHTCPIPESLRTRLEAFRGECGALSYNEVMLPPRDLYMEVREALQATMDWINFRLVGPIYIDLRENTLSGATVPK